MPTPTFMTSSAAVLIRINTERQADCTYTTTDSLPRPSYMQFDYDNRRDTGPTVQHLRRPGAHDTGLGTLPSARPEPNTKQASQTNAYCTDITA